uniref:Reverse transcriptase domain-containing protein n=1 Tax=Chenopodium quinoa TaxID=63459 RepID=A0A803MRR9_CHEQI
MGRKQVPISHLLFAYDILIFGETSLENILSLKDTLDTFCAFSGQTISVQKSKVLFSGNTSQNDRNLFCDDMSFRETNDLSPYLGFPISSCRPSKNRCMLLHMSVLNHLNSSLDKFLWGKGENSKGLNLVGWNNISRPRESGGLGIRCFKALNKAHLLKLWWRMLNQEGNLVVQILKDKYSKPNNLFRAFSSGSHLWKSMGKVWDIFKSCIQWGVGDGVDVFAWYDNWVGLGDLRSLIQGPLQREEEDIMLEECISNGQWWNFSKLSFVFPEDIVNICRSVPIPDYYQECLDFIFSTLTSKDACDYCHIVPKNSLHILRDCDQAKGVWELLHMPPSFFSLPLQEWLFSNLTHSPPTSADVLLPWKTYFSFILWKLWLNRNDCIFNQFNQSREQPLREAQALTWEFHISLRISLGISTPPPSGPCWLPPLQPNVNFNCDVSFTFESEWAGVAGVFRNFSGCGANHGAMVANDANLNILKSCRDRLERLCLAALYHEGKSSNRLDDQLAKFCRMSPDRGILIVILAEPLDYVRDVLLEDKPP